MELKRRITKIGKSLSPQIESMNVAVEMERMCDRFEELIRYAQEKIDRTAERKGDTIAKQADDRRKAADKEISDHQNEEAEENLKDQKEAFDERNKAELKTQKEPPLECPTPEAAPGPEEEAAPVGTDGERDPAEGNDEIPPAT